MACVESLSYEQRQLCESVAGSTLSTCRLRQRLAVTSRYFLALGRHFPSDSTKPDIKKVFVFSDSINTKKRFVKHCIFKSKLLTRNTKLVIYKALKKMYKLTCNAMSKRRESNKHDQKKETEDNFGSYMREWSVVKVF